MSDPLSNFLEAVESYLNDPKMMDQEVGRRVRHAWETMKVDEKYQEFFPSTIIGADGSPIRVGVTGRK